MDKKSGRPIGIEYGKLKYEVVYVGKRKTVTCKICKKKMTNSAVERLNSHRRICVPNDDSDESDEWIDDDDNENNTTINIEVPVINSDCLQEPYTVIASCNEDANQQCVQSTSETSVRKKTKQRSIKNLFDKVSVSETEEIDLALGKFIFSTNIPFRVVENKEFLQFIKILRPSYKVPNRTKLSTKILLQVSESIESKITHTISPSSVLIIDGWKNPNTNHQTVACVLHNADGGRAFLDAFNFTDEEIAETAVNLNDKLIKCADLAREKFNTNIYAVVSDNARNMIAMGNLIHLWHSTCSSHTANLLLMDPICTLIQNCQSLNFSIADACEAWQNISVPDQFSDALAKRKSMAINIYSKAANFLDPRYRGKSLSIDDIEEAEVFIINELDASGLESFQHYKNKTDFFEMLERKQITSPVLYWKCVLSAKKHQQLAKMALKLITIPASSAEIERVFSNWKFIHSSLRNRLNFNKSKKLVEIYYNINKTYDKDESDYDSEIDLL